MQPGRRWGLAVVRGDSMAPTLRPGDRLLVDYRRDPRAGDVVVARFPDGTLVVKRATEERRVLGEAAWFLLGDNPTAAGAMDSRHRGPIRASDVRGVVLVRCWPRPSRLSRRV